MEKIKLKGVGVGVQEFDLKHAQGILDLQKKVPPVVWVLDDERYEITDGKITPKPKDGKSK